MCDLPTPGTEPVSPALAGEFSITGPTRGCPVMLLMAIKDGYHLSNSVTSDSVTPWTAACQAPLPSAISWSWLKFMSIEWVMLSNHLILCHPLFLLPSIFPSTGSFPVNQIFASGGLSTGASASASVLPMNIQGWFPLGLTGLRDQERRSNQSSSE